MSKRAKPVKKRKRTDWKFRAELLNLDLAASEREVRSFAEGNRLQVRKRNELSDELIRYRLVCDWACQRIEKLEAEVGKQQREKRILLDTLFEVQAENIMQGEDILRQRDELIKLRGEPAERISL